MNLFKLFWNPSPDFSSLAWFTFYDSGGSSAPRQQTVTQLSYPEELQPQILGLANKAITAAEADYVPYRGERISKFDPFQATAQQAVANLGPSQQLGPATRFAAEAGSKLGDVNYIPTRFQTGSFTQPGISQQYMSPYIQNVVDIQKREAQRRGDVEKQRLQAQAVKAGAFGGSRQGVVEAEAQRNLAQQMDDIQAKGS
jgi:hypothetical protein